MYSLFLGANYAKFPFLWCCNSMVTASKTFFVGVDGQGDRRRGVEDDERGTKFSCIFASAMCGG